LLEGYGDGLKMLSKLRPESEKRLGCEEDLARITHETPWRDRGDGRATGQPQGLGPEAHFFSTSQGARPEDARKDGEIRGRSRWFVHNAG
jgi:hypothetical protein